MIIDCYQRAIVHSADGRYFEFGTDGDLRSDELTYEGVRFRLIHKEEWIRNGYSAGTFIEVK